MTDIVSAVKGFLTKHSTELATITNVLGEVSNALPIGSQDKAKIQTALDTLNTASDNIAKAVNNIDPAPVTPVIVKRSDLDAALSDVLPSILPGLIAAELAKTARPSL